MSYQILTQERFGATCLGMKKILPLMLAFSVVACGGCVQVKAPDKPIEINLNVNIKQEVVVALKKDANDLITNNPGLFPQ